MTSVFSRLQDVLKTFKQNTNNKVHFLEFSSLIATLELIPIIGWLADLLSRYLCSNRSNTQFSSEKLISSNANSNRC